MKWFSLVLILILILIGRVITWISNEMLFLRFHALGNKTGLISLSPSTR